MNGKHVPSVRFPDVVQGLVDETKDVPTVVFHCYLSQARCVFFYFVGLPELTEGVRPVYTQWTEGSSGELHET